MKKTYSTPKMIVHGNFEELTQVAGNNSVKDSFIFNGQTLSQSNDSLDIICTPNCVETQAK
jgi:hypothetical protein